MAAGGEAPSLWERVCAEYEAEQPQFPDVPELKHGSVSLESGILQPLRMEQFYSACAADTVGQQLLPIPEVAPFPEPPDPKICSPREYLEYYIFPVLLPGMAELLHRAKEEKCFERKRTKFIACDFLTEWLYNKNPKRKDESFTEFFSIPFVNDWLKDQKESGLLFVGQIGNLMTIGVSRHYGVKILTVYSVHQRDYGPPQVRCDSEIQELRQWQKQLREDKNIIKTVKEFWTKQEAKVGSKLEDSEEHTQNCSTSQF